MIRTMVCLNFPIYDANSLSRDAICCCFLRGSLLCVETGSTNIRDAPQIHLPQDHSDICSRYKTFLYNVNVLHENPLRICCEKLCNTTHTLRGTFFLLNTCFFAPCAYP